MIVPFGLRLGFHQQLVIDSRTSDALHDIRFGQLCDRLVFWKTECYTQALTAKIILKTYNLPSTLYIGFYKDEIGVYKGHAWIRSYDKTITGFTYKNYYVQSFFS